MLERNDPCFCGSGKKWKKCHYPKKPLIDQSEIYLKQYGIYLKNEKQIEKIMAACKLAASILNVLCEHAKPGITTNELDKLSMEMHLKAKAKPAPLGYGRPPYPKSICTSINDEICHGIPNERPLEEGDIVNIDVTSILDGYFGDCSKMVIVGGKTTKERKRVVDTSYECLMKAIEICKPGVLLKEIGNVIEKIAAKNKCTVVDQFVGHGVGLGFHEPPQVCHHYNHSTLPLAPGMTFTIEPMINAGVKEAKLDNNQWTARTLDGKASAQWEHTLLITLDGVEILTQE